MPIEIRELVIKATVATEEKGAKRKKKKSDQAQIVQQCVDQVMEILKDKQDR